VVGFLTTAFVQGSRVPERAQATPVQLQAGAISLPAASVLDGQMHFFEATLPEGSVRFFTLQVGDELRTCFDGCEICGNVGYYQQGRQVICRNCVSPIALRTLGRAGGCNPIPLESRLQEGQLIIEEAALREGLLHAVGR
jgi:uncharacterized membrane protein